MNAHDLKQPPYTEWTFQQKYQRMRPKDLIEVRLDQPGCEPKWVQARIVETNKGGAFVKVVNGHLSRFFKFSECRPCSQPDTNKPIATLGEVAKGQLPALQAPQPPAQKPLPVFAAPQQSAPPAPPPAPTSPPLVLFRAAQSAASAPTPSQSAMPDNKSSRTPHPLTDGNGKVLTSTGIPRALPNRVSNDPRAIGSRVGSMICEARKARGITQLGLADRATTKNRPRNGATVFNSRVSQIELGKTLPDDDELLAIAEALDLSLEKMIEARDMDQSERAAEAQAKREEAEKERERVEREAREARAAQRRQNAIPNAHAPLESRYIEPPRIQQQATRQPEPVYHEPPRALPAPRQAVTPAPIVALGIAAFVESVAALVPMPADSDLRKRWLACVMELYELSGSAS